MPKGAMCFRPTQFFYFWTTYSCPLCHRLGRLFQFYQVQSIWDAHASPRILMCDTFYQIDLHKICRHPHLLTGMFSAVNGKACVVLFRTNQAAMLTNLSCRHLPVGRLGESLYHHRYRELFQIADCPKYTTPNTKWSAPTHHPKYQRNSRIVGDGCT